jgi:hypothetical protein
MKNEDEERDDRVLELYYWSNSQQGPASSSTDVLLQKYAVSSFSNIKKIEGTCFRHCGRYQINKHIFICIYNTTYVTIVGSTLNAR